MLVSQIALKERVQEIQIPGVGMEVARASQSNDNAVNTTKNSDSRNDTEGAKNDDEGKNAKNLDSENEVVRPKHPDNKGRNKNQAEEDGSRVVSSDLTSGQSGGEKTHAEEVGKTNLRQEAVDSVANKTTVEEPRKKVAEVKKVLKIEQ